MGSSRLCFVLAFLLLSHAPFSSACTGRRCGQRRGGILFPLPGNGPCYYDAIYNFGDSISDTGNLVREGGGLFASIIGKLPYGETINDPTGRCSDGHLIIDNLAAAFNLPYLPPYLDTSANLDHGVNFAVAGATALDPSFFLQNGIMLPYTNSSLNVQLEWFQGHLNSSVCSSKEDCSKKLQKALFFVGEIGGNDYNYALMQGKSIDEMKTYVPEVVGQIQNAAQKVINAGATNIIVPGNFPIGCLPSYLTVFQGSNSTLDERNCLKELNDFADFHNQLLKLALVDLRKDNPDTTLSYADYYNTYLDLLDGAVGYGFEKGSLLKACCGIGGNYNFNSSLMCGNSGVPVCPEPTKLISWDGIHLTQEAYKDIADQLLSDIELLKRWKC